ncbi:MAG: hypothetical protein AB7Q16_03300 [Vicinamibacterales bacterium]
MSTAVAAVALVVALVALALVRRQARRIAELTDLYWQLRYDHGELKATVTPPPPEPPPPTSAFVPLESIKRSGHRA